MKQVFIGLGSNIGNRLDYLEKAIIELSSLTDTTIKRKSSVYETEPVGYIQQPKFLNMVIEIETILSPYTLLNSLKEIEITIGRKKSYKWGPREIDLDIIYYGNEIISDNELSIPHQEIANRRFVLIPLNEIAKDFIDPLRKLSIKEMLDICTDKSEVKKLENIN